MSIAVSAQPSYITSFTSICQPLFSLFSAKRKFQLTSVKIICIILKLI